MSGTPAWAIGGRWLEILNDNDTFAENENTATRVASGACCSKKGCCRVSGGQPDQSYILRSTPGRVNKKPYRLYKLKTVFIPVWCVELLIFECDSFWRYAEKVVFLYIPGMKLERSSTYDWIITVSVICHSLFHRKIWKDKN